MYPEHVELLYRMVPVGTTVHIVDQPIKVGWEKDELYLQVITPLEEDGVSAPSPTMEEALALIEREVGGELTLFEDRLEAAVRRGDGIPIVVGRRTPRFVVR